MLNKNIVSPEEVNRFLRSLGSRPRRGQIYHRERNFRFKLFATGKTVFLEILRDENEYMLVQYEKANGSYFVDQELSECHMNYEEENFLTGIVGYSYSRHFDHLKFMVWSFLTLKKCGKLEMQG